MTAQRKLLIFGDCALRAGLAEQFALQRAFEAFQASSSEDALRQLSNGIDVLLVAASLPGAMALIVAARAGGYAGSVILLTSADARPPSGVDACVARPFRFAHLLTQLDAVIGARAAKARVVTIGRYLFSADAQALIGAEGARIMLTEKETATLARLSLSKEAVPRDVLLADVWGYSPSVTTRTLETHIHRLRRKIEKDPARPQFLVTEPGGYRLMFARAGVGASGGSEMERHGGR